MHYKLKWNVKRYIVWVFFVFAALLPAENCLADASSTNKDTNYRIVIQDEADLLTDAEEAGLMEIMAESSSYGNVMFLSADINSCLSTYDLARTVYEKTFGYSDGVIFVIDMDFRMLWISGFGSVQYIITNDYCDTITDNVYTYASAERYYDCAKKAFRQIHSVLAGKNIPKPMKYICNFLLSLLIALLINYFIVMSFSRKRTASVSDLKQNMIYHCSIQNAHAQFTHETKVYNPSSSGSGSSGGGGGGGGGSSGGGHRF